MPLHSSTMKTSFSSSSFNEISGFGKDQLLGFDSGCSLRPVLRTTDNKVRLILGGGMLESRIRLRRDFCSDNIFRQALGSRRHG